MHCNKFNIILIWILILYPLNIFGEIVKLKCDCISVYGELINDKGKYNPELNCEESTFKKRNYITIDYSNNLLDSLLPSFKKEKIFVNENFIQTKPINPIDLPEGFSYYLWIDRKTGELKTREYGNFNLSSSETPSYFLREGKFLCEKNNEVNKF